MHKANRLAGTGGHYKVRQTMVERQDREREGTQIQTRTWKDNKLEDTRPCRKVRAQHAQTDFSLPAL